MRKPMRIVTCLSTLSDAKCLRFGQLGSSLWFGLRCECLWCQILGGRFGYFLSFSAPGRGRGSPERRGGRGVGFLSKIPGGEGTGRVSAGNLGELGGLNIFFGAEMPAKNWKNDAGRAMRSAKFSSPFTKLLLFSFYLSGLKTGNSNLTSSLAYLSGEGETSSLSNVLPLEDLWWRNFKWP